MPQHRHPADGLARVRRHGLVAPHDVAQVLHVLVRPGSLVVEARALVPQLVFHPVRVPAVALDALAQLREGELLVGRLLRHPLAPEPRAGVVEVRRLARDAEVVAVPERLQLHALVGRSPAQAFAFAVLGERAPHGLGVLLAHALRHEERLHLLRRPLVLAPQSHPEGAFGKHRVPSISARKRRVPSIDGRTAFGHHRRELSCQLLGIQLADGQRGATAPGNIHRRHRRAVHEHVSEQGQELGVAFCSQLAQLPSQEPLERIGALLGVGPRAAGELHLAARERDHDQRDLVQHHLLAPAHALVAGAVERPRQRVLRVVHRSVRVLPLPHAVERLLGLRPRGVELPGPLAPPAEREKQVVPLLLAQRLLRADAPHFAPFGRGSWLVARDP